MTPAIIPPMTDFLRAEETVGLLFGFNCSSFHRSYWGTTLNWHRPWVEGRDAVKKGKGEESRQPDCSLVGRSGEQKALKGESEILPPESGGKKHGFSVTSLPLASACRVTKQQRSNQPEGKSRGTTILSHD